MEEFVFDDIEELLDEVYNRIDQVKTNRSRAAEKSLAYISDVLAKYILDNFPDTKGLSTKELESINDDFCDMLQERLTSDPPRVYHVDDIDVDGYTYPLYLIRVLAEDGLIFRHSIYWQQIHERYMLMFMGT